MEIHPAFKGVTSYILCNKITKHVQHGELTVYLSFLQLLIHPLSSYGHLEFLEYCIFSPLWSFKISCADFKIPPYTCI